jgi:hypothetical protein
VDVVGRHHLGRARGKVFGLKTLIIANDHALLSSSFLFKEFGEALRATTHVLKGVILSDSSSPAVRTKLNPCHCLSFL